MEHLSERTQQVDHNSLSERIKSKAREYLSQQREGELENVYKALLADIEKPLLEAVMRYTRNNQSEAARVLGLSRGTLRKKLKQYFGSCYVSYR